MILEVTFTETINPKTFQFGKDWKELDNFGKK